MVTERFSDSKALVYILEKELAYREVAKGIELEICPFCKKDKFHFFINCGGSLDGVFKCVRCGVSGNFKSLQEGLGDRIAGVESSRGASKTDEREPLPDVEKLHEALLSNDKALDYLMSKRGFSLDIIKKVKIGFQENKWFRGLGAEYPAIVYPYLNKDGHCYFVHYRTLSPAPKDFTSPKGYEASLYNGHILTDALKEVILVEGEANTIALLDKGVEGVIGVPGANFKKAMWIDALDKLEKVYILYDKDKAGQDAAQNLAGRVGLEKCWKIALPDFKIIKDGGDEVSGKDINEWFVSGGTVEQFYELKADAKLFDVLGTRSSKDALTELEVSLEGKDVLKPTYDTPWPSLNHLIGFENGDVIDIIAPEKVGKTTFGMNLMDYLVDKYEEDGIIICLEMTTMRLARKWVAKVTDIDDSLPKTPEEAKIKLDQLKAAIPKARAIAEKRKGELYFCYPKRLKVVEDAYTLVHDCIRRYGVKWVMFDNLQLLADLTLKDRGHRTIHLSQISKTFAAMAKDYGIKFIRVLQPHRIKDGQIVGTDNVDGASQIEKDCDCSFVLHRSRLADLSEKDYLKMDSVGVISESSFDPKMLIKIGLSRYSSGGQAVLYFDGARSTVKEYDSFYSIKSEDSMTVVAEATPRSIEVAGEAFVI